MFNILTESLVMTIIGYYYPNIYSMPPHPPQTKIDIIHLIDYIDLVDVIYAFETVIITHSWILF